MRVHFVGNICNHQFDVARALRDLGVDAHLYLTPFDSDRQSAPESMDATLAGNYPPWIHRMRVPGIRFRPLAAIDRASVDELVACDLVHTYGNYATWIMGRATPYVIQPFGYDFSTMPFGRYRAYDKWKDFVPDPRWWGLPGKIRAAYRGARAIVLGNIDRMWTRGYQALLGGQRIAPIGLAMNTDTFSPRGDEAAPALITALRARHRVIAFQPTRQIWTEPGRRAEGGYSYGNDLFFRGLADAIRSGASIGAIVIDKGSTCTLASRRLVTALGLDAHVTWIPTMPRHELVAYYRHVDVTVDAFYAGGFGSACLEAMACACPVLMAFDPANRALYGEDAPVLHATDVTTIAAHLIRLSASPDQARAVGLAARGFVERHHGRAAVIPRYRHLHEAVLGRATDFRFLDAGVFRALTSPLPPITRLPKLGQRSS